MIRAGSLKLVFTGDLQLDRIASRVPERTPRELLRATTAWTRVVGCALAEHASLVIVVGSLAVRSEAAWHLVGPLERGIRRLASAGIPTVFVAGPRDRQLLDCLERELPDGHARRLGDGGDARLVVVQGDAPALVLEAGRTTRDTSSVELMLGVPDPGQPALPAELAPVSAATGVGRPLVRAGGAGTAPQLELLSDDAWCLDPGSPQAFSPADTGVHGPWISELVDGVFAAPEQRPLSTAGYTQLEVDLTGCVTGSACRERVQESLHAAAAAFLGRAGPDCRSLSLDVRLTGTTPVSHELRRHTASLRHDASRAVGDVPYVVDTLSIETLPPLDLTSTATSSSTPGALARLLLELEGGELSELSEDVQQLVRSTRRLLQERARHHPPTRGTSPEVTEAEVVTHLRLRARALLSQLVTS